MVPGISRNTPDTVTGALRLSCSDVVNTTVAYRSLTALIVSSPGTATTPSALERTSVPGSGSADTTVAPLYVFGCEPANETRPAILTEPTPWIAPLKTSLGTLERSVEGP